MSTTTLPDPGDASDAEALFAAWAARVEAGEVAPFEDVLAAHPEHAEALAVLHADWKLFGPLLGRAVPGRIGDSAGIVIAPLSSAGESDADAPSPELLERLGIQAPDSNRYRFRAVIGRGGGGVVLKVWDAKLNRPLAMKVVLGRGEERPDGGTPRVDGRTLTRFVDEARIASQLNHPGIVPVHELGADASGRAYFTMKLVKGEDFSRILAHVKTGHDGWNPTRALGVLLRVCESVAFAHEKGVIHRDLKPANVMVGRHGEVYVMDWGLARVLGEEDKRDVRVRPPPATSALLTVRGRRPESDADSPLYTMDGDVVGTPAYMAPEQAAGRLDLMGPHSDVYAVGAMLYHLLAGHMPYVPEGARLNNYAVWQRVQEGPPPAIETLASKAPLELVAICEKAMAREASRRYRGMRELAGDLRAFLEGRVVTAFETGTWAETRKWVSRNRAFASAVVAVIVIAISAGTVFAWLSRRLNSSNINLQASTVDLRDALGEVRAQYDRARWRALLSTAQAAYPEDAAMRAMLLREAPTDLQDPHSVRLSIETVQGDYYRICALRGHEGPVTDVEWSPDGERIVTASEDCTARVWNADGSGVPVVLRGHERAVTSAVWSPNGRNIATASDDGFVRVWSDDGREQRVALSGPGPAAKSVAWDPAGDRILVVLEDKVAQVVRADGIGVASELRGHHDVIALAAWSPDGRRVLTTSKDGTARVWNMDKTEGVEILRVPESPVLSVCWSLDGNWIVGGLDSGSVCLWSTHEPASLFRSVGWTTHPMKMPFPGGIGVPLLVPTSAVRKLKTVAGVTSVAFSPDRGRILAVADTWVGVLSFGDVPLELQPHSKMLPAFYGPAISLTGDWRVPSSIESAAWSPDGQYFATTSEDKTARIWTNSGDSGPVLRGHEGCVWDVEWSPEGGRLATASDDRTARVWSLAPKREPAIISLQGLVHAGSWSQDGMQLLADGVYRLDGTGERTSLAIENEGTLVSREWCSAWGPDGMTVHAISFSDGTIRRWNADGTGASLIARGMGEALRTAAWSPDRLRIVEVSSAAVRVRKADGTGEPVVLWERSPSANAVTWSPDGSRVAAGFEDGAVLARHADGSGDSAIVCEMDDAVSCVGWSPNGLQIAVGSGRRVHLWSLQGTVAPASFSWQAWQEGPVTGVMWSPDGTRILTVARDTSGRSLEGTARVWNADGSGDPLTLKWAYWGEETATWSPDGDRIATSEMFGNFIHVWTIDWPTLRERLWHVIDDVLSPAERVRFLGEGEADAHANYERQKAERDARVRAREDG